MLLLYCIRQHQLSLKFWKNKFSQNYRGKPLGPCWPVSRIISECFHVFSAARSALSHGDVDGQEEHRRQFDVGGVSCRALGLSGKIMCVRPHKGGKGDFSDRNKERVLIEFDSLQVLRLSLLKTEHFW